MNKSTFKAISAKLLQMLMSSLAVVIEKGKSFFSHPVDEGIEAMAAHEELARKNLSQQRKERLSYPFAEDGLRTEQAASLPDGWRWQFFDDGSGCLRSPADREYFGFDLNTSASKLGCIEYENPEIADTNKWTTFQGTIAAFRAMAEGYAKNHLLANSEAEAKTLPGWKWVVYADQSGLLKKPDGETHMTFFRDETGVHYRFAKGKPWYINYRDMNYVFNFGEFAEFVESISAMFDH